MRNGSFAIEWRPWRGERLLGDGVMLSESSVNLEPKMEARMCGSGGGIGYMPMAISTSDRPSDHTSLWIE